MAVLVTGAKGMLGQDLCPILEDAGYRVCFHRVVLAYCRLTTKDKRIDQLINVFLERCNRNGSVRLRGAISLSG